MTRPQISPRSFESEEEINLTEVEKLLEDLKKDFDARDLSQGLTADQANALSMMPKKLREYLVVLQQIKEEKKEIAKIDDFKTKEEKKKAVEEKLEKIAGEAFIIACASTLPIDQALKFHENSKLGVKGLNQFGENGLNPLSAALAGGKSVEELNKLLGKDGVDINFKSPQGNNAAHFAVMFGSQVDVMKLLIEKGVDVNLKNEFGLTPLDMAMMKGRDGLGQVLKENGAKLGRVSIPKEEEGEKDKKGSGRKKDEKRDGKKEEELKKEREAEKKEIAAEKREALEREMARLQRQAADIRIAMELAEESRIKAEKKSEKESKKTGLDFGFSSAADASKLAEDLKLVQEKMERLQVEIPKKTEENSRRQFDLEEKPQSKLEEFVKKLLGIDLEKMDINEVLLGAVKRGAAIEAAFFISCGANPNNPKVLKAAIESGNDSIVSMVALSCDAGSIRSAIDSMGSLSGSKVEAVLRDSLRVVETLDKMPAVESLRDAVAAESAEKSLTKEVASRDPSLKKSEESGSALSDVAVAVKSSSREILGDASDSKTTSKEKDAEMVDRKSFDKESNDRASDLKLSLLEASRKDLKEERETEVRKEERETEVKNIPVAETAPPSPRPQPVACEPLGARAGIMMGA